MEKQITENFFSFMRRFKTEANDFIPEKPFLNWVMSQKYGSYEKNILFDKVLPDLFKEGILLDDPKGYIMTEKGFLKIYYS